MMDLTSALEPWLGLLVLLGLVLNLVALTALLLLRARLNREAPHLRHLARRVAGKDVETIVREQVENVLLLDKRVGQVDAGLEELRAHHSAVVQKVGLHRYDVNPQIGGKLSFALCLLDGQDNGIILCSIYRLEDCQIYAREVTAGQTARPLGEPEQRALDAALREWPPARSEGAERYPRAEEGQER
jgi:hypothetical protein